MTDELRDVMARSEMRAIVDGPGGLSDVIFGFGSGSTNLGALLSGLAALGVRCQALLDSGPFDWFAETKEGSR